MLCGGRNSKGPHYAAVWRQGNLLHFGFQLAPDQMTEFGKGLLHNAIAYIARFAEDRPIAKTSNSHDETWMRPRYIADRLVPREGYDPSGLFDDSVLSKRDPSDPAAFVAWYHEHRGYLYPATADRRKLALDDELVRFGTPYDDPRFLDRLIVALADDTRADLARSLLERFVDAPLMASTFEAWQSWSKENRGYTFFSDGGRFRFYVDPLAKARGIPTEKLRGVRRADDRARVAELGPVRAEAVLVTSNDGPVFELRLQIQEGWHIYGAKMPDGEYATPTRLELRRQDGTEFSGAWDMPPTKRAKDGTVPFYEGSLVFRRRLRPADLDASPTVRCVVTFQACDEQMCRPPESLTVSVRRAR
ncbi:MAG: hypothetical protein KDC95_06545 [Planctomycetes bacterium]|nr:hypothetical protein [Planctomycetota bacterium]